MLYVFVACTVASVCLFVRAFIMDMVEDKMLSRFFLLLGIVMLMANMDVTASLWSLPFLAVIPVSVIVYRIRRRAPGFSHGDIRRTFSCSQLMPRYSSASSHNTLSGLSRSTFVL